MVSSRAESSKGTIGVRPLREMTARLGATGCHLILLSPGNVSSHSASFSRAAAQPGSCCGRAPEKCLVVGYKASGIWLPTRHRCAYARNLHFSVCSRHGSATVARRAGPPHPHLPLPAMTARPRLIIVLLLGATFMLSADFSILNIALPVVGEAVGLDVHNLPWVTTAFALPAAGLSLMFGRLGDLYGRRRIFLTGLMLLATASLLGGVSTGPAMLLTARAL